MRTVMESARLREGADVLWREIGGFGAIGAWHPLLAKVETDGEAEGAIRISHAADGSTQVERLERRDEDDRVYRYTMQSTPMPVSEYAGEFRISDRGDGTSIVTWAVQFEAPNEHDSQVVETIRGFLRAGTSKLLERYGEAP